MSMKRFRILILLILPFSVSLAQGNDLGKEEKKVRYTRSILFKSKGVAKLDSVGENPSGRTHNQGLIRQLIYVSKATQSKNNALHKYLFEDGSESQMADSKPNKCRVTNLQTGEVVDEYTNQYTCEKHFGKGQYRDVYRALIRLYARKFKEDVKNKRGLLKVKPLEGLPTVDYRSAQRLMVILETKDGANYKIFAVRKAKEIGATYTFIVSDPQAKNPRKGRRDIIIENDWTTKEDFNHDKVDDVQDIIKDLAKFAVENSGVWNGTRKEIIFNQNDILSEMK